jgi:predicted ATPase
MMSGYLNRIELTNFKCHKETSEMDIAPITLLVGPNSSGKTALIQPLLILKQTLEPKASSVAPIILNGNYVNLGPYKDVVYNHELECRLQIKLGTSMLIESLLLESRTRRLLADLGLKELHVIFSIIVCYSHKQKGMNLAEVRFSSEAFNFCYYPSKMSFEGEILGKKLPGRVMLWPPREQSLKSIMNTIPVLIRRPYLHGKVIGERNWATYHFLRRVVESVQSTIEDIEYIGPVREYPSRYYVSRGERVSDVGVSGEHAIEMLYQDKTLGGDLVEKLNFWLKRLGVAKGVLMREIDPTLFSLEIQSPYTNTSVNITDTGFGVSQIIPAIVQGHLMPPSSTLILEQPEIHLHPKAQAVLADLLIALAKENRRFIVETHSEHLILRLQRRVAEKRINGDKIRIYYFHKGKKGTNIRPIRVDSAGQLLDFPPGFMEEGLEEAYKLALASNLKE